MVSDCVFKILPILAQLGAKPDDEVPPSPLYPTLSLSSFLPLSLSHSPPYSPSPSPLLSFSLSLSLFSLSSPLPSLSVFCCLMISSCLMLVLRQNLSRQVRLFNYSTEPQEGFCPPNFVREQGRPLLRDRWYVLSSLIALRSFLLCLFSLTSSSALSPSPLHTSSFEPTSSF